MQNKSWAAFEGIMHIIINPELPLVKNNFRKLGYCRRRVSRAGPAETTQVISYEFARREAALVFLS
jgi:hypothetical protein